MCTRKIVCVLDRNGVSTNNTKFENSKIRKPKNFFRKMTHVHSEIDKPKTISNKNIELFKEILYKPKNSDFKMSH